MPGEGQPQAAGVYTFDVTDIEVAEPGGVVPYTIIPDDQPFTVSAKFAIGGLSGIADNDLIVGGTPVYEYHIEYYAECIGPGDAFDLNPVPPLVVPSHAGDYDYSSPETNLNVAAGTLPAGNYRLTCVVRMHAGGTAQPAVGYWEGPMIQIYTP